MFATIRLVLIAFGIVAATASPAAAQTIVAATGQTVATGATGQQILFRDKTSVTVGPNSAVTVTRADYDRSSGSGNVVITVTKGAFRYITGDTAGSHTIKTPLSTIGVRGTVIEGFIAASGHETFVLVEGAFSVTANNGGGAGGAQQSVDVRQPGGFVNVSPHAPLAPPAPMTDTMRGAMLQSAPTLNLVQDNRSEVLHAGRDPLVRFRDATQAISGAVAQLPPPPPVCVPSRFVTCP